MMQKNNSREGQTEWQSYHADIYIYIISGDIEGCPIDNRADSRFAPANERRRYKVTPSLIGWAQI